MSVLVYTESDQGTFKKTALEAVSYAKGIADSLGTDVVAVAINAGDASALGKHGASKLLNASNSDLSNFNAKAYAAVISQAAQQEQAEVVVVSSTADSKYLAPLLAVNLESGYVPNVTALPTSTAPFKVNSNVFSNKAFAETEITTATKLIALAKNAYGLVENETAINTEDFNQKQFKSSLLRKKLASAQ